MRSTKQSCKYQCVSHAQPSCRAHLSPLFCRTGQPAESRVGAFLKMTCLKEQGYLPAKSCAVVSIQPAKRHQQHSHHQDQLEAYLYKVPVVESVQYNRHKDKLVVHRTFYKCEKGSSFCCSNLTVNGSTTRFASQTLC